MSSGWQRFAGAVGTVAVAAAVNVATGFLTDQKSLKWWVSGAVLLVAGIAVQWLLPTDRPAVPDRRQRVTGTTVGGSVHQKMHGAGEQTVAKSEVTGDLSQVQDQ